MQDDSTNGFVAITVGGSTTNYGAFTGINSWHHIAIVWTGTGGTVYIDGAASAAVVGTPGAATGNAPILYQTAGADYATAIDESAIYSVALTAAQVAQLWNAGAGFNVTS